MRIARLAFLAASLLALAAPALAQPSGPPGGGPVPPPSPWLYAAPQIYAPAGSCVTIPQTVTGGCIAPNSFNISGNYYVNGVAVTVTAATPPLAFSGGTLSLNLNSDFAVVSSNLALAPTIPSKHTWAADQYFATRPFCDLIAQGAVPDDVTNSLAAANACLTALGAGGGTIWADYLPGVGGVYCLKASSQGTVWNINVPIRLLAPPGVSFSSCGSGFSTMQVSTTGSILDGFQILGPGMDGESGFGATHAALILASSANGSRLNNLTVYGGSPTIEWDCGECRATNVEAGFSFDGNVAATWLWRGGGEAWNVASDDNEYPTAGGIPTPPFTYTAWSQSLVVATNGVVDAICQDGKHYVIQASVGGTTAGSGTGPTCKNYGGSNTFTDGTVTWLLSHPRFLKKWQYDTGATDVHIDRADTGGGDVGIAMTNLLAGTAPTAITMHDINGGNSYSSAVDLQAGSTFELTAARFAQCLSVACKLVRSESTFTGFVTVTGGYMINSPTALSIEGGHDYQVSNVGFHIGNTTGVSISGSAARVSVQNSDFNGATLGASISGTASDVYFANNIGCKNGATTCVTNTSSGANVVTGPNDDGVAFAISTATTIPGGINGCLLYDNAGVLGCSAAVVTDGVNVTILAGGQLQVNTIAADASDGLLLTTVGNNLLALHSLKVVVNTLTGSGTAQLQIGNANLGNLLLNGTGSGIVTLTNNNVGASNFTQILQAANDTIVSRQTADALLNKTLTSSTDVLGGVTMTLGSDATGDIYYRDSGGLLHRLPIGTNGQGLKVITGLPAWGDPSDVTSVSNSDGTLTISPITGAVVASLNTAHANTISALWTFNTGDLAINGGTATAGLATVTSGGVISSEAQATLAQGGTNANLTASNGGIVYSGASAFAVLAGTATANLPLLSGASTTPSWAQVSYFGGGTVTSGGIPYFSSTTAMGSSALLAANAIVIGGGAGTAPSTTTTGTGVLTAIGNAVNTNGGLLTGATAAVAAGAVLVGAGSGTAPTGVADVATGALLASGGVGTAPSYCTACTVTTSITTPVDYGGAVAGSTKTINGTSNGSPSAAYLFLQTNSQNIGIGTVTAPSAIVDASLNAAQPPTAVSLGIQVRLTAADNGTAGFSTETFNANGINTFRRADGTAASPSALAANDPIGTFAWRGYVGTNGYTAAIAQFACAAAEAFTNSTNGTYCRVLTTPTGGGTITEAMRWFASGGAAIGNTTDPAAGGLDLNGQLYMPNIASDTGLTDATACIATSSSPAGKFLKGTGTLGICLGTSSARYKHDIEDIDVGMAETRKLNPRKYHLDAAYGDPNKLYYGLTAEEVARVMPTLVGFDDQGRPNTVDLLGMVPVLVADVQDVDSRVTLLNAKVADLQAANDNLSSEVARLRAAR